MTLVLVRVVSLGVHESYQFFCPTVPLMHTSRALTVIIDDEAILVSNMPKCVQRSRHIFRDSDSHTQKPIQNTNKDLVFVQQGENGKRSHLNPFMAPMVLTIPSPC